MQKYEDIDENSNGYILQKAREEYAKKNNIKFGQKELAEYLVVPVSTVGGWEQNGRKIPDKYFTKINNLLGTNLTISTINNNINNFQATLCFYFGLYKFTKRQCEFIISKLVTKYCKDILSKEENKKYNNIMNSIKKNNIFTNASSQNYKNCYTSITNFLNSNYSMRNKQNTKVYINKISGTKLTELGFQKELYYLLTTLNFDEFMYEPYQNIPVYNSSGVIEFYEKLNQKFNDNTYEYVYFKIDTIKNKFPPKYEDGAIALLRLGTYCFPNEDILIQIGNSFHIEHIRNKNDIEQLKKDYSQWLIEDYKLIGSIVMIDYTTCSITHPDYKITF